jgi:hypothetical protein
MRPEIADALDLAKTLSDSINPDRRMSEQESALRLIVVSLVSVLQAYLSELLEEKADQFGSSWDQLTDIEKRYVGVQCLKRLDIFFDDGSDKELAEFKNVEMLRQAVDDCASWFNNPVLLSRSSYRQKLDGFLQNNGSNVLDRIISRYSACELNFLNWLNKLHPKYRGLSDVLDIVIAVRNDVAHGTFSRRITLHDVRQYRVLIYRMIGMIEPYILSRKDGSPPSTPLHSEISVRAFSIWLERGCGDQDPTNDWLKSERELKYQI